MDVYGRSVFVNELKGPEQAVMADRSHKEWEYTGVSIHHHHHPIGLAAAAAAGAWRHFHAAQHFRSRDHARGDISSRDL